MGVFLASKATSHAPNFKTDMLGHENRTGGTAQLHNWQHWSPIQIPKIATWIKEKEPNH